ncbi:MAG: hypothetical protein ABW217_03860 [Polyangiaceae bacterium]
MHAWNKANREVRLGVPGAHGRRRQVFCEQRLRELLTGQRRAQDDSTVYVPDPRSRHDGRWLRKTYYLDQGELRHGWVDLLTGRLMRWDGWVGR